MADAIAVRIESGESPEQLAESVLREAENVGAEVTDAPNFEGRAGRHPKACVCSGCQAKRAGGKRPRTSSRKPPSQPQTNAELTVVEPEPVKLSPAEIAELSKILTPYTFVAGSTLTRKYSPAKPYTMDEAGDLTTAAIPVFEKYGGGVLGQYAAELALLSVVAVQVMARMIPPAVVEA